MFAKLLSRRRSRKPLRRQGRGGRRLWSEQLEPRIVLNAGGFVQLEFATELTSLNLSGGPYPLPLGPGWTTVDSEVSITLSSQRAVDPGMPSLGTACAFPNQPGTTSAGVTTDNEFCYGGGTDVIDPNDWDGQEFFVDSFFDVFFDITVTDVDPANDFAGMPDAASIQLNDNGPASLQSNYTAIFDKDAPNFGLIPPPQVDPYIGHFLIEIPLGADLNGNANPDGSCIDNPAEDCNDKIKFELASHAAGDGNRQFITQSDGTVLDQFDSAAFLEGAVVDERDDPPFTLGAGDAFFPAFSGPGALTGPTTATSTLMNPVVNAAFSFVDADNDKMFTAAGMDVALVGGELDDGVFDTQVAEGGYTTPIPDAGLYIGGTPIVAPSINFTADGNLVVNTDLTANRRVGSGGVAALSLTSRNGDVLLDDPTLGARRGDIAIDAAGAILSTEDRLLAGGGVKLTASYIGLNDTYVFARKSIQLSSASDDVDVTLSTLLARKNLVIDSAANIYAEGARLLAPVGNVELRAVDSVFAFYSTIGAATEVGIEAGGDVDLTKALVRSRNRIKIQACAGTVDLTDAVLRARKRIAIQSAAIVDTGATIMAKKVNIGPCA